MSNVSTGKILAGVSALSIAAATTGVILNNKPTGERQKLDEIRNMAKTNSRTIHDQALINFLETEDQDIQFRLMKLDSTPSPTSPGSKEEPLTRDNFYIPTFYVSELKAVVEVNKNSDQFRKKDRKGANLNFLLNLNNNEDWVWECGIQFTFGNRNNEKFALEGGEKLFNDDKNGLLDILSRNLVEDANSKNLKEIKKHFIKQCAALRWPSNQENVDKNIKNIKSLKIFSLSKDESSPGQNKYLFQSKGKPWEWFGGKKDEWKTKDGNAQAI